MAWARRSESATIQSSAYPSRYCGLSRIVSVYEECFRNLIGALEDEGVVAARICDAGRLQLEGQIAHGHHSAFQTRILASEHDIDDADVPVT